MSAKLKPSHQVNQKLGLTKKTRKPPAKKSVKKKIVTKSESEEDIVEEVTQAHVRNTLITRKELDKWCHAPFFSSIIGLHVRIAVQNKYYIARIANICTYQPYKVPFHSPSNNVDARYQHHNHIRSYPLPKYTRKEL